MVEGQRAEEQPAEELTDEASLVNVSESRVRILKALDGRPMTVSELGRALDRNKSTLHGYLQELVEDGLIQRHEEDERLWVYYSLSPTGEKIVRGGRLRLAIDISSVLAFLGSLALFGYRFLLRAREGTGGARPGPWAPPPVNVEPWLVLWLAVGLLVVSLVGLAARVYLQRRLQGIQQA